MKQLKDISLSSDPQDVDVLDEEVSKSPKAILNEGEILNDIQKGGEANDISIETQSTVQVSKRKGKNFDALEKKGLLQRIKKTRYIRLSRKKQNNYLLNMYLVSTRKIKDWGYIGKIITLFFILLGLLVLGYFDKIFIEKRVNSGYEKLIQIKQGHISLEKIQKNVNDARFDLLLADSFFFPFSFFSGEKISSVESVISGGRHVSHALDKLLLLYVKTQAFIDQKSLNKVYFTQLFLNIFPELQDIETSLEASIKDYKNISWLPRESLEQSRQDTIKNIESIQEYLSKINTHFSTFLDILGHSKKKRYLVVFQNADELRPAGGFMGSMGLLEIFRGKVELFQKKDVYAIEWDLKKSDYTRQIAPKGIRELTPTFGLRDANYYVNLKDSSKAIQFFMNQAGIEIDGVIYLNQNILLHLLEITGPVPFDAIGAEVSSENFSELMSLLVEAKAFKTGTLGTPKQILFDFMEVFSQKLIQDASYFSYLQSLMHDVKSRDIMIWSFHEGENKFLEEMGMNGKIDYTQALDFMYPVYTSLSGNKSDRYVSRSYSQKVTKLTESCDYNVETTLKSSHNMTKLKREEIQSLIQEYNLDTPKLLAIQGAERNRQFIRVILPQTAVVTPQKDMEIIEYGSRKGIEFFLNTGVQETSFYTFSYLLKNPECQNYDFMLYKQAGIPSYNIDMQLEDKSYKYLGRKEDFYFTERK